MALSNSTDYSIDRDTLIKASLRLIGVGSVDEDPTASEITNAAEALNIMVKAWQADGLHLWQVREYSLTPLADTVKYPLGASVPAASPVGHRPLRIGGVRYKNTSTGNEVSLDQISREEYDEIPNKTLESTPTQYYYDPQLTNGNLYIWPEPNATFVAGYTLEVEYSKPFDDMDVASTDDFEFPSEWYEAIKWGLAARLAPEYGIPLQERNQLIRELTAIKETVMNFDQEPVSVFFKPDMS